ncbi:MAG: hypothetical protein KBD16_03665 [Candidatus Pacebacteria bacterium]|nr:hypothetical protein [Candidatus Paceibacterota bacterium]
MTFNHHAYLLRGTVGDRSPESFLSEHGFAVPAKNAMSRYTYETLGIDDARELFTLQLRKSEEGTTRIFLIETMFITREAQNALLKMLEEPSADSVFMFVTPHPELLIPTLQSRFAKSEQAVISDTSRGKTFLSASHKERATIVAGILEDEGRSSAEGLIRDIVVELHRRSPHGEHASLLEKLETLRRYATDTSSSMKMLLEYVALSLPQSK